MEISNNIEFKTHRKNLLQLVYLRSIAIVGQLATILIVHYGLEIMLPVNSMYGVISLLIALNIISYIRYNTGLRITSTELLIGLLLDAAALTAQLYLSGGAANPFVTLFLLQVIIGAILLRPAYAWALFAATFTCHFALTFHSYELKTIYQYRLGNSFDLYIHGMLLSYTMAAFLLVWFITNISANLKERDMLLAQFQQQSLEEDHVLRMGLLAAGAAHELGTPLTTISVILKDMQTLPFPESSELFLEDIATMQRELDRSKAIVSGILLSSGQVRGEDAKMMNLREFMDGLVEKWIAFRKPISLQYNNKSIDLPIISDTVIRQMLFNLFDNALEASPDWVAIEVMNDHESLIITVQDRGEGFSDHALKNFGKPYESSKSGHGRGLGLFLVVNTLRKIGGKVQPYNTQYGATVKIIIPLAALGVSHG